MRIALLLAALTCLSGIAFAEADLDSSQRYLAIYLEINDAEHLEQKQDLAGALKDFQDCDNKLTAIHNTDPDWEKALVLHRLEDIKTKILDIQERTAPGANVGSPKASIATILASLHSPMEPSSTTYPWKTNIPAKLFWIGENGEKASAWNDDWVKSNGGADAPDDRNGYSTASHAARLNPFYVALPFNDLALPAVAQDWVPRSWRRMPKDGKPVSACKDRWVEMKSANGRACYAQWEDAGPNGDQDPDYVFGSNAPKAADKPALLVSPAVAEYLGWGSGVQNVVSWRFVDEINVPPGAWLKYDEQALIYAAMNK